MIVVFSLRQGRHHLLHLLSFLLASTFVAAFAATAAFSWINHHAELLAQICHFVDKGIKALWFVVPVNSQEINWDPSQHDGQANTTHHRLRVQREDEEEGPKEEVNNWPNETDLDWSMHVGLCESQHNLPGNSDSIKEVVDKPDVVDESVHVAGAEHEQSGEAREEKSWDGSATFDMNHG